MHLTQDGAEILQSLILSGGLVFSIVQENEGTESHKLTSGIILFSKLLLVHTNNSYFSLVGF